MRKNLVIMFATLVISVATMGQSNKALIEQKRADALKKINSLSEEQIVEKFKKYHQQIPQMQAMTQTAVKKAVKTEMNTKSGLTVPDNMIFPNEADEVQAILMTWIYDSYTISDDSTAMQLFDGKGVISYDANAPLFDIYSVPDVASNSPYAKLFAKLANGIQQYAQVWINIWYGEDSTAIKSYMASQGMPLRNYRFFVNPGNSFWYRDCGPVAFYFGDEDSIAFMDFEYYGGRPLDDKLPIFIGEQAGFPVYTNTLEYEGGNILLDGVGSLFTSSAVFSLNQDSYGLYVQDSTITKGYYVQQKTPLTQAQVRDSLKHLLNLNRCLVLPSLNYDGGTGHVDLYMDMWDENTFVSTKFPDTLANLSDPKRIEKNMDSICNIPSMHGNEYFNTRIPLPAKNDGTWYTSQQQYTKYTRSFSNHTFVNGAIMQPVFYSGSSGDVTGNKHALDIMKKRYPGYEFVEIDVRSFDGAGGAIHCITKQIPAENPVRIYCDPLRYWNTNHTMQGFTAIAQNKSGIQSLTLYYRNEGTETWSSVVMDSLGDNMYDVAFPLTGAVPYKVEYYLSATSNNGKTITKPMTAPQGYYTCFVDSGITGVPEEDTLYYYAGLQNIIPIENQNIGEFYPNPAKNNASLRIEGGLQTDVAVKVVSVKGQVLHTDILKQNSTHFEINTGDFRSGVYWVIFGNNGNTTARKLVVIK